MFISCSCQDPLGIEESTISIGGKFNESRLFNGAISALEIYVDAGSRSPNVLKNLIISYQMIRNGVPLVKKKKSKQFIVNNV